jgi:hypothetical protein
MAGVLSVHISSRSPPTMRRSATKPVLTDRRASWPRPERISDRPDALLRRQRYSLSRGALLWITLA